MIVRCEASPGWMDVSAICLRTISGIHPDKVYEELKQAGWGVWAGLDEYFFCPQCTAKLKEQNLNGSWL